MTARILVFGAMGQVGRELALLGSDIVALTRDQADLTTPGQAAQAIADYAPRAVINAAAYTAVDRAESEPELAHRINADAVGEIATTCADAGIPLVHISTDYVFDGTGTHAWQPKDTPNPLGVYGHSKLAGERAVQAAGGPYVILRTSWVVSAHGHNFVKTMRRLGRERDVLTVVSDQIGAPTGARDIAHACREIADQLCTEPDKSGIYHFAGTPYASWADVARAVMGAGGLGCQIQDIPSAAYPTPAPRPRNSRLDCSATKSVFGIAQPDWRDTVATVLRELGR